MNTLVYRIIFFFLFLIYHLHSKLTEKVNTKFKTLVKYNILLFTPFFRVYIDHSHALAQGRIQNLKFEGIVY